DADAEVLARDAQALSPHRRRREARDARPRIVRAGCNSDLSNPCGPRGVARADERLLEPLMPLNPTIAAVTARIVERSKARREVYLDRIDGARGDRARRRFLSCGNLAHGFAG